MFYYKVIHKYKLIDHIENKNIGIYSSLENATKAVKELENNEGFIDTKDGFSIKKVFKLFKAKVIGNSI